MNSLNKYEKILAEKLQELPLPDEEVAWQDMKRRLDEDKDKRPFILPLRFGCALFSMLLAVALLGLLYFYVLPLDKNKKQLTRLENPITAKIKSGNKTESIITDSTENNNRQTTQLNKDNLSDKKYPVIKLTQKDSVSKQKVTTPELYYTLAANSKKNKVKAKSKVHITYESTDTDNPANNTYVKELAGSYFEVNEKPVWDTSSKKTNETVISENIFLKQPDSIATVQKKADSISIATPEKNKKKKEIQKINFSTGLALWQRIDNAGPKPAGILFPNGTGGSGGSGDPSAAKNNKLFDYVPSVYARMYKGNKWFLQSEFRYRAPQYERDLLYSQKGVPGPFGNATATKIVTKTYYHQVPLAFNYFVTKNWSIGAGVIWNKFNRAVTVEQVRAAIPGFPQRDTLLSTKFTDVTKADSNFTKYYFQGVIESQYRWRKFSLGIRYAAALQPYLKFTLPGGAEQKEKNSSLQLFLRYELWKSKKQ
jgi:hypothetical protein